MAVQEQTPYIEYVANGVTKSFPITFYFDEKYSQLRVGINDDVIETGWSVVNGQVVFAVAPALDSLVKITRLTTLNREVNYQTYNNSLRPDVLNLDFDRVWYALQEQDYKLEQYDFDYSYAVNKSNQAFQSAYNAMQRADQAYTLADQIQPINKGGTGANNPNDARNNLNTYSKEEVNALVATGGEGNVVGITGGGTGASTAEQARENLGVLSAVKSRELMFPLGTPLWHNGVESTIPVGHLPYNGQLLSRSSFPAFWAIIQQRFAIISEAEWLANPEKRGCYSSGDGVNTFRMPDLNGVQTGSIKAPVLRGDGGGTVAGEAKTIGQIDTDAIREINGTVTDVTSATGEFSSTGAFTRGTPFSSGAWAGATSVLREASLIFKASNVVPTAPENRMNSVYGIWICRVGDTQTEVVEPTKHAVLTGGNTFNGSQSVNGSMNVSAILQTNDLQVIGNTNLLKAVQALGSSDALNINQLVANTWCTNTTGRPIFVSCSASGSNVSATITVRKNGVDTSVAHQFIGNNFAVNVGSSGIVLNGLEYKVSSNTNLWF